MASLHIPTVGALHNEINVAGPVTWGDSDQDVRFNDSTAVAEIFAIDAQSIGHILVHRLIAITDTLSTSLDATIGDSDDVDGYFTSTVWNPAAAGVALSQTATLAYQGCRLYTSAHTIGATLTAKDTGDGGGKFFLIYSIVDS